MARPSVRNCTYEYIASQSEITFGTHLWATIAILTLNYRLIASYGGGFKGHQVVLDVPLDSLA